MFLARMIAEGSHQLPAAMGEDHTLALDLLGLKPNSGRTTYDRRASHPIADAAASATPARATMLTLVMLLAALERDTDRRRSWDRPSREEISYFNQLRNWGYPLSDVEQLVLASTTEPATSTAPSEPALESGDVKEEAPAAQAATISESTVDATVDDAVDDTAEDPEQGPDAAEAETVVALRTGVDAGNNTSDGDDGGWRGDMAA